MRKLTVLGSFLLLSIAVWGGYSATGTKTPAQEAVPGPTQKAAPGPTEDAPGTIDGAVTPDLIPDDVAYALFFNFLAGRETKAQKNSLKSFFKQRPQLAGIDAEVLMMVADEFQEAYKAIEKEEAALAATSHNRSSTLDDRFALLKQRKLSLVDEKVGALPNIIGMDDAEKVRRHVREYVKRKVKIAPPPPMPAMD